MYSYYTDKFVPLLLRAPCTLHAGIGWCKSTKTVFAKWQNHKREVVQAGKAAERRENVEPFASSPELPLKDGDVRATCNPDGAAPRKKVPASHPVQSDPKTRRRVSPGKRLVRDDVTYGILQERDSEGDVILTFGCIGDRGAPLAPCPPQKKAKPHAMCVEREVVLEVYRPLRTVPRAYERDPGADRSARLSDIVKVPTSMLTPEYGWDRDCVLLPCSLAELRADRISEDGGTGSAHPSTHRPASSYGPLVKDDQQVGTGEVHLDSWNNNSCFFNCMIPLFISIEQTISLPRGDEVTHQAREFFGIIVDLAKKKDRRLASTLKVRHEDGS